MRYNVLDGFRGFFLLFMMIVHLNGPLDTVVGKLNHHYFGWVEDAQGFVFISGVVVGLVYGGVYLKSSFGRMRKAVYGRISTIFSHQAALILTFACLALVMGSLSLAPGPLADYLAEPVAFTLASLLLVSGSMHMGILPMYIWFMLVTPLVLVLLHRQRYGVLLTTSTGLWLLAQTGLIDLVVSGGEAALAVAGHPVRLGIFFNVFGWQVIFFLGLFFGFLQAERRLDLSFLKHPQMVPVFLASVILAFALGLYDRIVFDDWISAEYSAAALASIDRGNFSVIYLIAFLVDLFIVVWLVVAGPGCPVPAISAVGRFVNWLFCRKPLVFLGQHSLHVFSWHILVVYAVEIASEYMTFGEVQATILMAAAVASLYGAAAGHAHLVRRRKVVRELQASRAAPETANS